MNKSTRTWIIVALLALVGVMVGFNIWQSRPPEQQPLPPSKITEAHLLNGWTQFLQLACTPSRGDANAPWTLIECGDFQCPSCGKMRPVVEKLIADSKGQCKLLFINYPLVSIHKNAQIAADASLAAEAQGKFWPMFDAIYKNQDKLESIKPGVAADALLLSATQAGLDLVRYKSDIANPATDRQLLAQSTFVTSQNINETPTYILRHNGDNTIYVFQGAIEQPPKQSILILVNNAPWNGKKLPPPTF